MNPLILGIGVVALVASLRGGKKACPELSTRGQIHGYDYLEFVTGGANPEARLPLIIYFHSLGSRPEKLAVHLEDLPFPARVVMPTGKLQTEGGGPIYWQGRARTENQEQLGIDMHNAARDMVPFIKTFARCRPTVGKPIVVGHSQGGMMTLAVAAVEPSLVRAAVAASGWLPENIQPNKLPPTIDVHGTRDDIVSYQRTKQFVEQARAQNIPISLIPVPGAGHRLHQVKPAWRQMIRWAVENT